MSSWMSLGRFGKSGRLQALDEIAAALPAETFGREPVERRVFEVFEVHPPCERVRLERAAVNLLLIQHRRSCGIAPTVSR